MTQFMRQWQPLLRSFTRRARGWSAELLGLHPVEGPLVEDDLELLRQWLAGPGSRPTEADRERWTHAAKDGLVPHRHVLR